MDKRINDLKQDFNKVVDLKNENVKMFDTLDLKIKNLKAIYAEFIKNNKQQLFIFGLDSFHFQGKLIDIEYDDMKRLYYAITNRVYCEYFKLYKIVVDYITENVLDDKKMLDLVKVNNTYPIYKDLEPFKQYDFEIIQSIHETIIGLLNAIHNYLLHKEHDLKIHQEKNATGLNIDNFIQTFNFNNVVLREKLVLFTAYIEFFHKLHTKYFKRFTTKMQLFVSQINNDIKFEDSAELNKTKRQSMLENFENDNIDKNILTALKNSIQSPSNQPSTPTSTKISEMFQSINSTSDSDDVSSKCISLTIEEHDPSVKDQIQVSETNSQHNSQNNSQIEQDVDDVSLLTTDSDSKTDGQKLTNSLDGQEQDATKKPKRKYTPRKTKNDPIV